jgi:hypothetical protein
MLAMNSMVLWHAMCCSLWTMAIILTPTSVCSFPQDNECNSDYAYLAGPKKVVLMGNRAVNDFLASIKAKVSHLNITIIILVKHAVSYQRKVNDGNVQAAIDLVATEDDMKNKKEAIGALKVFFVTMQKDWSEVNNHIIGHVVWAPLITGLNASHSYTQDICVIKLDKKKFKTNFMGNVIDLGAC